MRSTQVLRNSHQLVAGLQWYENQSSVLLGQSLTFTGIGSVIAPVLGSYVLFTFDDQAAIDNVQWIYLAIAVFVILLAILFLLVKIPEITDADMAFQAQETNNTADQKPFYKQFKLFHASFAQFCYCGSQVAIASFFINYAVATRPGTDDPTAARLFAGAQAAFAVGRFVGVGFMKFVKPRIMFLVFLTGVIVFTCPSITQKDNIGISMLYVVLFFESICFPTIVALGMRGLGRHTKRGSGYIIGAVIGGACVPPLTGVAADSHGNGIAMVVPLCFFLGSWSYALCCNFVPNYVTVIDSFHETDIGLHGRQNDLNSSDLETRMSVEEKAAVTIAP
jgi:FHS family L-fucose permease-like MFS transporter